MNAKALFTDESAVSPVIGVVLMVAITVLLAATAATFFLSIGQQNDTTKPNAAIVFDYEQDTSTINGDEYRNDNLQVGHDSGETIEAKNLDVVIQSAKTYEKTSPSNVDENGLNERFQWDEFDSKINDNDEVSGGESVTLKADSEPIPDQDALNLEGSTVKVVWDDPGSKSTFTLNTWTN
ncbi:flagellin N-terminal-like domain-containing protein [Halorientalis persicus]|uniref:Flagellin N-terminal-like domain-containing protein n=1 Tax=Halorientalis persicus TaxID=1367881 RepID=A0A1H8EJ22_9EURY|nr:type IV pilin N-terminal domain-containing protein [Halorientalis persicus]SEN19581.1 flagellin N-terminal-like domain-containing protein [Halorientalis persicus]